MIFNSFSTLAELADSSLHDFVHDRNKVLDYDTITRWAKDIAKGMMTCCTSFVVNLAYYVRKDSIISILRPWNQSIWYIATWNQKMVTVHEGYSHASALHFHFPVLIFKNVCKVHVPFKSMSSAYQYLENVIFVLDLWLWINKAHWCNCNNNCLWNNNISPSRGIHIVFMTFD